ncbi:putative toxin-antitoxin system toxin component, PIN family [Anabaena sp. UHCC 0187]|uniref:putative toxin-antitoxin system toxin component, PIN family n=1 Tax=Anabaena sp. UHCC 0187 TaxID=2590018 RepID=UPI00144762C0|nr:putative toxin-antitoxin system toxin component, PIN family [Anabaena sp. UHCC 0187]MTJ13197.1 putative toxin-antitoxin system toxin component, PIN family [Anabaena sp. UHCC 0187]
METKVRAVIDTSVYLASFKSRSTTSAPVKVIDNLREGNFLAIVSPQIFLETQDVATRQKHGFTQDYVRTFFGGIKSNIIIISGYYTCYKLDDIDIKDNMILAAALESKADYIISLDREHLLPLKNYQEIQIVNPHQFLKEFKDYESIKNAFSNEVIDTSNIS